MRVSAMCHAPHSECAAQHLAAQLFAAKYALWCNAALLLTPELTQPSQLQTCYACGHPHNHDLTVLCSVSVLEPVPDSTKLRVTDKGLQLLRALPGHLAPVVVIGPYRSGKSFLINQMLNTSCGAHMTRAELAMAMACSRCSCVCGMHTVSPGGCALCTMHCGHCRPLLSLVRSTGHTTSSMCWSSQATRSAEAGMVVGHQRTTQTRGVWLWSKAIPASDSDSSVRRGDGEAATPELNLIFFDTEGFESTGQSGAYDDRIFAFAAIISSTLVYNLAEAVRESDIEKLSFAVELAQAFFPQYSAPGCGATCS